MLQKAKPWSLFCKTMNKRWLTKVLHWLFNVKYAVLLIHYIILNTLNDSLYYIDIIWYNMDLTNLNELSCIHVLLPLVIKIKNMNNILYMALTLSLKIRNVISLSSDRFCSHVTSLVIDLIYRTTGFEI